MTSWVDRDRLAAGEVAEVPRGAARARDFVALGRPVRGMELRVVDKAGGVLPADRVGEIEIRGAAVTRGYLGAGAAEAPAARGGWLPTGDLGFVHVGDLYVTGRRKEMIIIRGENYYPEDAEAAVRDLPDCTGADAWRSPTPPPATPRSSPCWPRPRSKTRRSGRLAAEIHTAVCQALDLDRGRVRVHLVDPDALPRTSSGKFRRSAARELAHERTQEVPDGTRRSRAQL